MLVLIRSDSARIMYSTVRNLDMRMTDPTPTFSHLITAIRDRHPEFGYVHLVEPRHTPRFHALVDAYPDAVRARGYLEGYADAARLEVESDLDDDGTDGRG